MNGKPRIPFGAYLTETQAEGCVEVGCENWDSTGQFGVCLLKIACTLTPNQVDVTKAPDSCPDLTIRAAKITKATS